MKLTLAKIRLELVKEAVRTRGFPVHMGTPYCFSFEGLEHPCENCESSEGCKQVTGLMRTLRRGEL